MHCLHNLFNQINVFEYFHLSIIVCAGGSPDDTNKTFTNERGDMSDSFQREIPKARINLKLDLHTGGAQKKTELPLKLLVAGDFSNGKETLALSERNKININKNNFNSVLADYSPSVSMAVENTLAGDGSEENVSLTFRDMNDFSPEQVARQIPQLKAMLAMRNLLRDLKANLLDNQSFRKELEKILLDPSLSAELRNELSALAPKQA
jgi:type VI secretion system protein ImpB